MARPRGERCHRALGRRERLLKCSVDLRAPASLWAADESGEMDDRAQTLSSPPKPRRPIRRVDAPGVAQSSVWWRRRRAKFGRGRLRTSRLAHLTALRERGKGRTAGTGGAVGGWRALGECRRCWGSDPTAPTRSSSLAGRCRRGEGCPAAHRSAALGGRRRRRTTMAFKQAVPDT